VVIPLSEAEAIVQSMDRCGVDRMIGSSFTAIHGETTLGNTEAAQVVAAFPNRLYAYAVINPHYPGEVPDELARCFTDGRGFVGLKFHCGLHGVQLEHAGYDRALAFADEHALPVLVHGGGRDRWREVCLRYPRASFIIAHACAWDGFTEDGKQSFALAREVANLYVDVAGSASYRGALRALVDLVGVEKVLYGSDFPMFDLAFELGRVTLSELSPAEKAAVWGGNAMRIFTRLQP
jgi:predicted TIM-barrel fold metal-dependent hydrolase